MHYAESVHRKIRPLPEVMKRTHLGAIRDSTSMWGRSAMHIGLLRTTTGCVYIYIFGGQCGRPYIKILQQMYLIGAVDLHGS